MSKFIDARGKACPMPVILAKKEIDKGETNLTVIVDNEIAVENLTRLANNKGIEIKTEPFEEYNFKVIFAGGAEKETEPQKNSDYTVYFGKDYVGEGDYKLGNSLAKMMLYTLAEGDDLPKSIIFMNSGVKIPTSNQLDVIKSLSILEEKGVEVLVCGTCLNYYGLTDKVKAGTISNMYEILEKMKSSQKVISI